MSTSTRNVGASKPSFVAHARFVSEVLRDSAKSFVENEGYRLGAAFAYYATSSVFPMALLAVTGVGYLVGDSASAREHLLDAVSTPASPIRAVLEQTLTAMQESQSARGLSAAIGLATLLFSASGTFVELDVALNRIWSVPPRKYDSIVSSIWGLVIERVIGFALVAFLGFALLVSLASSSVLHHVIGTAHSHTGIDTALWPALARGADVVLSMALLSGVFTAAFHFIPRTRPPAHVVVSGAVLTTALLTALKELFATYLAHLTKYSAYGVVGGFLALTTWIYASSQIILFGAQLTRVYAEKIGAMPPTRKGS